MQKLTPESWRRIQQILAEFDELPAVERPGFLAAVARDDPALGLRVEALVRHDDKLDRFLERPLFPVCSENLDDAVLVPRIGPYKLVKDLGEGGMGVVYLAVQERPFQRQVALKLIQPEKLSPDTVRRFEAERAILARIRHPNVAQLYDGGTTPDGRPYFVMEYVEGEPLEVYCNTRRLSNRARLDLFLQVCSAVHLAHQKLRVVHRDLKPGNILVTPEGVPKLLDFGIAKPIDSGLDRDPAASTGASVWTPHYTSPEQLAGLPLTTASDIYSLGVLLYQLLAGSLPYPLESTELEDVRRAIDEGEPKRLGVDGDLDAIALKALSKKPDDRYASVDRLVADIHRYLNLLPVEAREPTCLYRFRKFVVRRRIALAVAVVFVILTGGLILTQAKELAQVRRISASLVDLLKALQPATPGQRLELEQALEQASLIVHDPMFASHPLDQAVLLDALGRAFTSLGSYDRAGRLLDDALAVRRRDLGEDHLLVAESLHNLAFLYQSLGDASRAEDLLRRALEIRRESSDPEGSQLSEGMNNLAIVLYDRGFYAEAEALFHRVIVLREERLGDRHPDVLRARSNLAAVLVQQGAYAAAEALYRTNLEIRIELLGEEHKDVASSRNQLATVLYARGDLEAAESEVRQALEVRRRIYGSRHRNVALVLNNLGTILHEEGALGGAEAAYREALAIFRGQLGEGHSHVAVTQRNLAAVLTAKNEAKAAEELAAQALTTLRANMAPGSWRIADAESVYAGCLAAQGRFAEAEEPLVRSFEIIRKARGDEAPYTREAARRLVALYEARGEPERAAEYRQALEKSHRGKAEKIRE